MVRCDQGNESPNTSFSITFMIEPKIACKSLQAALDDYPMKGDKIDYERVTGVRKAPGTKKKKPKKK